MWCAKPARRWIGWGGQICNFLQSRGSFSWNHLLPRARFQRPMAMLQALIHGGWDWYRMQLSSRPLRTQIFSSAIIWAVGDVLAQSISFHQSKQPRSSISLSHEKHILPVEGDSFHVDWRRVLTLSLFGAAFVAPVGHWWYESLDNVVAKRLKLEAASVKFISTKVVADTLVLGPLHLLAFFTYMGIASGKNLEQMKEMLRRDFVPAYITEGCMWPIVQTINFRFVPVQHQLLYVNAFCLVDSVFLSWFKYQEDAAWKRWLMSLISPKLP